MIIIANKKFNCKNVVKQTIASNGPVEFQNCDFTGLDLTTVKLDDCKFTNGCKLQHTKLGSALRCCFYSSDISHADFRQANISWAKAADCKAEGLDLRGCIRTEDCFFYSGLLLRECDAWALIYHATLPESPIRETLRNLVPRKFMLYINALFKN